MFRILYEADADLKQPPNTGKTDKATDAKADEPPVDTEAPPEPEATDDQANTEKPPDDTEETSPATQVGSDQGEVTIDQVSEQFQPVYVFQKAKRVKVSCETALNIFHFNLSDASSFAPEDVDRDRLNKIRDEIIDIDLTVKNVLHDVEITVLNQKAINNLLQKFEDAISSKLDEMNQIISKYKVTEKRQQKN